MKRFNAGNRVAFQLGDAICPEFDQIVAQTGPDLTVAGEIVMFSDRGEEADHFAVVQVNGIHVQLIVPVTRLNAGVEPASHGRSASDEASRTH